MSNRKRTVFVDPSYKEFYFDNLFDTANLELNRDGTLLPFARLKEALSLEGSVIHSADYLIDGRYTGALNDYYSLGILDNIDFFAGREDVRLCGFFIMEPPVVAPKLYQALPKLTKLFKSVYVHNVDGDGYSLKGVDRSKLKKLYWPQPHVKPIKKYWENDNRLNRIVVINGNHIPRSISRQLYGRRIQVMCQLARLDLVDLYGRGWRKWWSHRSMWPPYWLNYKSLMSIYRGECESKYEVLSNYNFSLCFENMSMKGYVTEKIFDCFYAGTIPIYLGASDIDKLIPGAAYIDMRDFSGAIDLSAYISQLSLDDMRKMRLAGKRFLESKEALKYHDSLLNSIGKSCHD